MVLARDLQLIHFWLWRKVSDSHWFLLLSNQESKGMLSKLAQSRKSCRLLQEFLSFIPAGILSTVSMVPVPSLTQKRNYCSIAVIPAGTNNLVHREKDLMVVVFQPYTVRPSVEVLL